VTDDAPRCFDEAQVRWAARLLSEALSPDDGRAAGCRRLLDGLAERIGADAWMWVRSRLPPLAKPVNIDFVYGGGMRGDQLARISERMLQTTGPGSEHPWVYEQMAAGRFFTAARPQMIDDAAWRADSTMAQVRAAGIDELLYSWVPLSDGEAGTVWSGTWFFRAAGRPAFDPAACRLVHLVMSECGPLHAGGVNLTVEPALTRLTPKQRLVLVPLLDGRSPGETADHTGLSVHTVNDHVQAIYGHFRVQSRAELLAQFMQPAAEEPA